MTETLKRKLQAWAAAYHRADFIGTDPVQFPHRYTHKQDIEASGLLTALISFGNRTQILRKAEQLHALMGSSQSSAALSGRWERDFPQGRTESYYRMVSYADVGRWFARLHAAYCRFESLEDALRPLSGSPMQRLCGFWGVSACSPQKKLNMYLRWMVRRDSEVDFGLWRSFSPADLIIPLDTHVCRVACRLGLTDRETFSLSTARRITAALAEVFPGDPCLGDFALFGSGANGGERRIQSTRYLRVSCSSTSLFTMHRW